MTMSTAFQNALGGLAAASRGAAVVSDNVANALTPGFARRSLELTTASDTGSGVRIVGIARHTDPVLTGNRRNADATLANAQAISEFHSGLEMLIGAPDGPDTIPGRLTSFENSLIMAAGRPESATRLDQAVADAKDPVNAIRAASDGVQKMRADADRTIGQQVERLNQTLKDIETFNARIQAIGNSGGDTSSLLDQRQNLIDTVNELIPVNVVARENDRVSLYSDGGLILLEGRAADFSFATSNQIMPHMTGANGLLSQLEFNGKPIRTTGGDSGIRGGGLAAQFSIRDELAIEAQSDLDALARDLIERFETAGLDPTSGPPSPGLFTDSGSRFDPTTEQGIAGRLTVNALVDPDAGGSSWKLRSGLGAALPGDPGDARQLQAFSEALSAARPLPTSRFGTGVLSAADVGAALMSKTGSRANSAAERLAFATATRSEMARIESEQGVDTDSELQRLMQIEQTFAANARIIQVVSDLMDDLLRI
ncbi:flagellar biosynthesis protein FlgK [Ruegeria marisrubri]|uniref:Flagellar hook-associated protein 1 n=1 Tax=Ruegeria marisrubri TaxID=1685379 RepID=A0A0X3TQE3_9RHOB|nr:flagellar hook-associated protein FlgK [Ruegeria marisrubri]KUJ77975.1 flagellar biosynthesis protein FlgK [Ruegeria marisrubri]